MLPTILLSTDADGDSVTSCAIQWDRSAAPLDKVKAKVPRGGNQRIALEALQVVVTCGTQTVDFEGRKALPYSYAMECVTAALAFDGTPSDRCKERAKEAIHKLVAGNYIQQVGNALNLDKSHLVVTSAVVSPVPRFPEFPNSGVSGALH